MLHRYVLAPLMCLFMVFLTQVPASADVATADEPTNHCVVNLKTGKSKCYSSFADSMSALSRGKFTDLASPSELTAANWTGGRHGPQAAAASVSSTLMNDRASSVRFW